MRKEHTSIANEYQLVDDMGQMGWEAVLKYLDQFDVTKPGTPYVNRHIITNEINSKLNDYGRENRNDREKRAKVTDSGFIDYKSQLLRTQSIDEIISSERYAEDSSSSANEAILEDINSITDYENVEAIQDFKAIYEILDNPLEKKILFRFYFEYDSWTQTSMAKDLHISPIKLKRIRKNIEHKAVELGITFTGHK